jgi:hypothetical protein
LHNAVQRFFIANGRSGCKGCGLARELVKDSGVVGSHARILGLKFKI